MIDFVGATLPHLEPAARGVRLVRRPRAHGQPLPVVPAHAGRVRATEVWQSRDLFDFFYREEIEPLPPRGRSTRTEITTYDVHTYLTQGPDAASESQRRLPRLRVLRRKRTVTAARRQRRAGHVERDASTQRTDRGPCRAGDGLRSGGSSPSDRRESDR